MTKYMLSYQPKNGRPANETSFDSMLERDNFTATYAPYIDVLKTWLEAKADTHYIRDLSGSGPYVALCGIVVTEPAWHSAMPTCDTCEAQLSAEIQAVIDDSLGARQ